MTEELKKEVEKLREEMKSLKEHLKEAKSAESENIVRRRPGIYIDLGHRIHDYVEDTIEGVAEGIQGELEKSVFIGPRGIRIYKTREADDGETLDVSLRKVAEVMNALGEEHRLGILKELMSGGKYVNELQEKLSEITVSTLSSHLKVLEEAGLVVQEKARGRYLITMPGRVAYKMSQKVARFLENREES